MKKGFESLNGTTTTNSSEAPSGKVNRPVNVWMYDNQRKTQKSILEVSNKNVIMYIITASTALTVVFSSRVGGSACALGCFNIFIRAVI